MSRSISSYSRPKDLPEDVKKQIRELFSFPSPVSIDFDKEEVVIPGVTRPLLTIPMESLGKMFGIMQQHCVTVRKSKKESKLKQP